MTQEQALAILMSGKNVFITGPAGSGKTFLLNRYVNLLREAQVAVAITASTGIAATHLNGITIHSWTGMGIRESLSQRDVKEIIKRGYLRRRFLNTQVLIIDEISMLAHYQLDMADQLFRAFKQTDAPFGGIQVVLCGDFFQLPPIGTRPDYDKNSSGVEKDAKTQASMDFGLSPERNAEFAYCSQAWKDLSLKICYLDEQHRTGDSEFLAALNAIRKNEADDAVKQYLQHRVGAKISLAAEPTKIYTHNADVDIENDLELSRLEGKEYHYRMELIGPLALSGRLQKSCLAPADLRLKVGARVMFVKNNFEEGYVNGTLGIIQTLAEDRIIVRTSSGAIIDVGPASWHIAEDGDIKAEIVQYPLRLAWAITVHKSQGMSLDAALVDLRQSFEPGMGYVALSRVRSSSGLSLAGFNDIALRVNDRVLNFDKLLKEESLAAARAIAGKESGSAVKIKIISKKTKKDKKPDTIQLTGELLLKGLSLDEIAVTRNLKAETVIEHCEKIKEKNCAADFSGLVKNIPLGRLIQMKAVLRKCRDGEGKYPLKPAMEIIGDKQVSYNELRLARLLL